MLGVVLLQPHHIPLGASVESRDATFFGAFVLPHVISCWCCSRCHSHFCWIDVDFHVAIVLAPLPFVGLFSCLFLQCCSQVTFAARSVGVFYPRCVVIAVVVSFRNLDKDFQCIFE